MIRSRRHAQGHWIAEMGSSTRDRVVVELHMTQEMADKIVAREKAVMRQMNPESLPWQQDPGAAAMSVLQRFSKG